MMMIRTGWLVSAMVCIFIQSLLLPAFAADPPASGFSNQEVQDNIGIAQTTLKQMKMLLDFMEYRQRQKQDLLTRSQPAQPIAAIDQSVLNVILAEQVASNKGSEAYYIYHNSAKSFRVVLEIEMSSTLYPNEAWDQLYPQPEFAYKPQLEETCRDVQRKNKTPVSWKAFQPATEDVFVADLRLMKAYLRNSRLFLFGSQDLLETLYPQAMSYLSCWRPGYSEDGQFALLVYETPGAHGTNHGRYFLQKQGSTWKILLHQSWGPV